MSACHDLSAQAFRPRQGAATGRATQRGAGLASRSEAADQRARIAWCAGWRALVSADEAERFASVAELQESLSAGRARGLPLLCPSHAILVRTAEVDEHGQD